MQFIKLLFWEAEGEAMQLHPRNSEYINNHKYCLHLWRPKNTWIPMPPTEMVGVKVKYRWRRWWFSKRSGENCNFRDKR